MKQSYGGVPLYVLQPNALINFAAQTLEFASHTLGYRDPCNSENAQQRRDRPKDEQSGLDVFSIREVAEHDSWHDCWIILYDKVFDVTKFLSEHPGGDDIIMEHAGQDATLAFRGAGHSAQALQSLGDYQVGILPENERMYTGDGPCKWSIL
ncbi:cytochrome b5-like [Panulirus ornatus]|uniref:cytochrome b5-like n=1 Tax=Panulirus ornatus TaxID=150431 RepID=UPI003A8C2A42